MKTRGNRRALSGTVLSNKAEKTIVVQVEKTVKHPVYKKYIKRKKKYMAHDPENQCQIGDTVIITESRPLSKYKRWILKEILEKAV
jgi:small subunit ribosomal protein S17